MRFLQARRRAPGRPALSLILWWTGVRALVILFLKLAYRMRMDGAENVPSTGPIVYVSNHQSNYDPCIVGSLVGDRPLAGVARSGLFRNPVFAWIINSIGAISIEQGKGDSGAMKAALRELAAGRCVLIFPEGTRTRDGAIHEFKRGVTTLIKRSGNAWVVPVALEGAYDIWPIGQTLPKLSGRIAVRAGKPIAADELMKDGPNAAIERLRCDIEIMRLQLRREMRQASGGRYPKPGAGDHTCHP